MQIELIETFLDLVETQSFNKTAERMGVTQSTVSARIKALESALDTRLLERSRAGTTLSRQGFRFAPHARVLRLTWEEARKAVKTQPGVETTLRIGIQHDLAGTNIAEWLSNLRAAMPETALYLEADYSPQMCTDITTGKLDAALIFTPKPHPDLHFESLGEITYRCVSTQVDHVDDILPDQYFLPNYSPAFSQMHAQHLPHLSAGPVSSGQSRVIHDLLLAFGGSTYLMEDTAQQLVAQGRIRMIEGAPAIQQPVLSVLHLRNRHRPAFRRVNHTLRDLIA